MTRKDYTLVANALSTLETSDISKAAVVLSIAFRADNPRFNREMFLKKCGLLGDKNERNGG